MASVEDERMGAFDAVMWGVEDDPLLRSVIVVMVLLESAPDRTEGTARVDRLTRQVPQLRQRVIGNPFSLVPPRWETDPNFDLAYHLSWVSVPDNDSSVRGALRIAERMAEQDFDRNRPLWEMTLVTGLDDGRAAVLFKIHHSITDGVGGMMIAASLFDLTPEPRTDLGPMPDAPGGEVLDPLQRLTRGVNYEAVTTVGQVRGMLDDGVGLARKAVSDPVGSLGGAVQFASSAGRLLAPAGTPLSPVMTGRSLSVHFDELEVPLADLKAAAAAAGGTVNDVFLAAVTGGLRAYHEAMGEVPDAVRVNMPVNLRAKGDATVGGNSWVPARFAIPIREKDPAKRIRALHPLLLQARTEPALPISNQVFRLLSTLPNVITTNVAGGLMKGTDVAATNVPGPPFAVYLAGARVRRIVPYAPKAGAAVNIALMSYDGVAQLGVNIDTAAITDPALFTRCLGDALAEVVALGSAPPPAPKARTTAKKGGTSRKAGTTRKRTSSGGA